MIKMNENDEKLKKQLIKIYERYDFEFRGNKEKVVDATMTEIAETVSMMLDQMYNLVKNKK